MYFSHLVLLKDSSDILLKDYSVILRGSLLVAPLFLRQQMTTVRPIWNAVLDYVIGMLPWILIKVPNLDELSNIMNLLF
jgi:hypothetical protein